MICPNCGSDTYSCSNCGNSEHGDDFMKSHHDHETEPAKLDNIILHDEKLWRDLQAAGCYEDSTKVLVRGASVYKIPKITYIYKNIFSRKTCPRCRSQDTHYMKKLKKLLCLECGTSWQVKILRRKRTQCERRVIRIPLTVYKTRGDTFSKPKGDREQRASDVRSKRGNLAAHRIKVKN
ncbi:MAG: hypothetical protein UT24_C0003G0063 [Candidatus Woesebacteria bacterium GW2011_GWB1_39_12]|uniref:Uncharacterized protein n=1 Tax=Candidatus Woesebacteria bacterium GW2011_GWB1_39_12 TaxID=1618574 RepID=A0A0G0MML9_9BACT|nr:MAG: hypothetical protein UT24_C0003G0063 [Candidatus Woesebacteria bacterium GW2011_GWB1_39_12]